mgnify:FL=1|tara:strand:+ start:1931 stop:2401 length:471 start_codon:yes stop_codon:yes gene_type:complete
MFKVDIEKILLELETLPEYKTQIALQTVEGWDWTDWAWQKRADNAGDDIPPDHLDITDFVIPAFDIPYINSILKELGMVGSRVMTLLPSTCYSYHKDDTKRIHIPIVSNDKCFMIVDGVAINYPADGNYYVVDTTKIHTALNGSPENRLHIVGIIV